MPTASSSSPRLIARPLRFARLIKIEHSVYALPFAYAGAVLAELAVPSWETLFWITVAMVAARSAAMALNRLIDARIDARNPRTADRELASGTMGRGEVIVFTAISIVVLVLSTLFLSPPTRFLWPIVVAAFVFYPFAKRFTWFCHYALGLTDGLAPAAAWVAVSGSISWPPVLLFFAVGFWVGGFDVIYAIFDLDFDRREDIHSIPVSVGETWALRIAALSHIAAVVLLVVVGILLDLGPVYAAGMAVVALLLAWSNVDIHRRGLERVGMGFMTVNGVVGIVYGFVAIVSVVVD